MTTIINPKKVISEMRPARHATLPALLLSACLVVNLGCGETTGKPTVDLQGSVKIDGQPIPADAEGSITFMPKQSGQARPTSARIVDGRYDAKDVPLGAVSVAVSVQQKTGKAIPLSDGSTYEEYKSLLPEGSGGEQIEVTADMTEFDLSL